MRIANSFSLKSILCHIPTGTTRKTSAHERMVPANLRAQDPPVRKNAFVHKLYSMLNEESLSHLIWWSGSPKGHTFSLCPGNEFAAALGGYFKHGNVASFVRQLHMYGFHKVSDSLSAYTAQSSLIWEFRHSSGKFRQGDEAALAQIRRRLQANPHRNSAGERRGVVSHIQPMLDHQQVTPQYDAYFQGYPQPPLYPQPGLAQQYPTPIYPERNVYSIHYSQGQPGLQQSSHNPIYFANPGAAVFSSATTPSPESPGPFSWNGTEPQYFHQVPLEMSPNHASRVAQAYSLLPMYQPHTSHELRLSMFHALTHLNASSREHVQNFMSGSVQADVTTSRFAETVHGFQKAGSCKAPALSSTKKALLPPTGSSVPPLPQSFTSATLDRTSLTDWKSSEDPKIGLSSSQSRPSFEFRKPFEGSEFRSNRIPSLLCDPFTKEGLPGPSSSLSQQSGAPTPIPSVSRSSVVSHGHIRQSPRPTLPSRSGSSPVLQTAKLDSLSMARSRSDDMRKALLADTSGSSFADRIRPSLVELHSTRPPQTNALMRSVDSINTQQSSIFSNGSSVSSISTGRLLSVGSLPQLAPPTASKAVKEHEEVSYTGDLRLSSPPSCEDRTKNQPKECLPTTSTSHEASDAALRHPKLPKLDFMLDLRGDSCLNTRSDDRFGE